MAQQIQDDPAKGPTPQRWTAKRKAAVYMEILKGKTTAAHNGEWALGPTDPKVVKAEARAGDAVAVLRERAGRLLRR